MDKIKDIQKLKSMERNNMKGYIIYSGFYGFNSLTSSEAKSIYGEVMPDLLKRLEPHKETSKHFDINWGYIFAIYDDVREAVSILFELREFYKAYENKIEEVNKCLCPFIYGCYEDVQIYISSSFNSNNYYLASSKNSNYFDFSLPKNDIYVAHSFRVEMLTKKEAVPNIKFIDIGFVNTGTYLGEVELLKVLRDGEETISFEKLKPYNLEYSLPMEEGLNPIEMAIINSLNNTTDIKRIIQILSNLDIRNRSSEFLVKLSKIYDKLFLYDKALDCINLCKEKQMHYENTIIYPSKNKIEVLIQEAWLKTKLGKYDEAYNIIYGLYFIEENNMEVLELLAFYFKRRALFDSEGRLNNNLAVNRNFLYKSKDIYLEVYRRSKFKNLDAALNAAYLFRIIGKMEGEKGKKLGRNIFALGSKENIQNIELKIIMAESKLVQHEFSEALSLFSSITSDDNFTVFHRRLVYENIMLYDKMVGHSLDSSKRLGLNNILEIFK